MNPTRIMAAILCGGASRRMGQDKARLPHPEGGTLLDRAVSLGTESCGNVILLSGDGRRYSELGLLELADTRTDSGPLAGLVAALRHVQPASLLLFAVDMAGLEIRHLEALIREFNSGNGEPVVAIGASRRHPTLSVWAAESRPALELALEQGRLALHPLLDEHGARELELPDAALVNWNRPEDLER